MIKDLIQNKFTSPTTKGVITPALADLRSIMSDRGDPKKNSERLRLMLPKVRYPQPYNEIEYFILSLTDKFRAFEGHPT